MNCLWGFKIFVNAWFRLDTLFRSGVLLTSVNDMFMFFIGNFDTNLLLKPVNVDGVF